MVNIKTVLSPKKKNVSSHLNLDTADNITSIGAAKRSNAFLVSIIKDYNNDIKKIF